MILNNKSCISKKKKTEEPPSKLYPFCKTNSKEIIGLDVKYKIINMRENTHDQLGRALLTWHQYQDTWRKKIDKLKLIKILNLGFVKATV